MSSVDGLVSGLDTTSLINKLLSAERAPQNRLITRQNKAKAIVTAYQSLNTKLAGLRDAAAKLAEASGWRSLKASSSTPGVASATAGPTAVAGTLSFTVNNLATAASAISAGSVTSMSSPVHTDPLFVAAGGAAVGVTSFQSTGMTLGAHTVKVTQASSAASKTGTTAVAASTVITAGVNDVVDVEVDGVTRQYTLAAGTYTASGLASALQTASGGDLRTSVDGTGHLVLRTSDEGSAATLLVTGGSALTDLGLTGAEVGGTASAGTDGVFDVDGTVTTVSDVRAGTSVVLTSGTGGTLTATLGGGLRIGSVTGKNVSTGDGTLAGVVNAINGANVGVTAAAIQVAPGELKLQLSSSATGTAGALSVASAPFAALGGMVSFGDAKDASITVGSGVGAFTTTSSSNTVSNLLPGTTLTLAGTGATTVSVQQDVEGLATRVGGLVDQINNAIAEIKKLTGYDADTKTAGLLMGDPTLRQLQSTLLNGIIDEVASSTLGGGAGAGISTTRTGTLTFDRAKFVTAYNSDPAAVTALFQRSGTSASTSVALAAATNGTRAGVYGVVITQAAAQATATGTAVAGEVLTAAETIDLRVGGATGPAASYAAQAGESLASVAEGLNRAAAAAGIAVLASVETGALVLRSTGYGQNAAFEVRSSATGAGQTNVVAAAGAFESHAGTNVAGTINGVVANGIGRLLQAPPGDPVLAGLTLNIGATSAEVTAAGGSLDLGDFTYVAGVAQRLATIGHDAVDVVTGSVKRAVDGRQKEIESLEQDIERWDRRIAVRQAFLRQQFSAMETALSSMRQQSNWLAGQVGQLNSGGS